MLLKLFIERLILEIIFHITTLTFRFSLRFLINFRDIIIRTPRFLKQPFFILHIDIIVTVCYESPGYDLNKGQISDRDGSPVLSSFPIEFYVISKTESSNVQILKYSQFLICTPGLFLQLLKRYLAVENTKKIRTIIPFTQRV